MKASCALYRQAASIYAEICSAETWIIRRGSNRERLGPFLDRPSAFISLTARRGGVWVGSQPWILRGKQTGSLLHTGDNGKRFVAHGHEMLTRFGTRSNKSSVRQRGGVASSEGFGASWVSVRHHL